jgi:hypothetical protein
MQFGANCLAGRTSFHGATGVGDVQRRVLIGGCANGTPRNASTSNCPVGPSRRSMPSMVPEPSGSSTVIGSLLLRLADAPSGSAHSSTSSTVGGSSSSIGGGSLGGGSGLVRSNLPALPLLVLLCTSTGPGSTIGRGCLMIIAGIPWSCQARSLYPSTIAPCRIDHLDHPVCVGLCVDLHRIAPEPAAAPGAGPDDARLNRPPFRRG